MVKKKKGKLFWIVLVIALILLVVLYGFVVKKKFIDVNMNNVASGEDGVSGANSEAVGDVFDSDSGVDAVGDFGGGSGDSSSDGGIVAPPVIPEVDVE